MKMNKKLWLSAWATTLIATLPVPTWASGGRAGNGAGLAEQNFIFAYESLPKSIASCFQTPNCAMTLNADESKALDDISTLAAQDDLSEHPLIFVSGRENPGFFDLSATEPFRIAKTGLDSKTPIWINSDLLYKTDGTQALDFPAITAILIHEVGHQTGRTDHAFLDLIGAKVRSNLQSDQNDFAFDWSGAHLDVQTIDFNLPVYSSDVYYSFASTKTSITGLVLTSLHCNIPGVSPVGFKLSNGHWDHPSISANGDVEFTFLTWAQFSCLMPEGGELHTQSADLKVTFTLKTDPTRANAWTITGVKASSQAFQTPTVD